MPTATRAKRPVSKPPGRAPLDPATEARVQLFTHGINRARLTLVDIAKEMNVSWSVLELYTNRSIPSERMAAKLGTWLRKHGAELIAIGEKLPREKL